MRVADNAHLYALSSFAADVWVGGADGALFHSADDGLHWTSVSVPDSAAPMHAVITRIELLGGKSVKLTVKGGGQWVTFDAGAHWRHE